MWISGTSFASAAVQRDIPDDGYLNMYQVMKALTGSVQRPDGAGPRSRPGRGPRSRPGGLGYCIAYMRALFRAANEEVG